jgi:predicted metal-dependent phosphoesterase TrpH
VNNFPPLNEYRADLHVHTVVSPCADVEMIPPLIVTEAMDLGIDIIAITDHNSVANVASVIKAAENTKLTIIPGMEVQTAEDVHVVCLFPNLNQALEWGIIVNDHLPSIKNNADYFGEQFIVDETGDFLGFEERLLLTGTTLSFEKAYRYVTELGGLFIPAHVNRKAYGLIENLGFVPFDTPITTLEVSRHMTIEEAKKNYPQIASYHLIQNGDVHYLTDFSGALHLNMEKPTFDELVLALSMEEGRSYFMK